MPLSDTLDLIPRRAHRDATTDSWELEVRQIWQDTVLASIRVQRGQSVRVGADTRLDAPGLPIDLVTWEGSEPIVHLQDASDAVLELDARRTPMTTSGPLPRGARIAVAIGSCQYVLSHAPRARRVPLAVGVDLPFVGTLAMAAFLGGLFGATVAMGPGGSDLVGVGFEEQARTFVLQRVPEPPKKANDDAAPGGPPQPSEAARPERLESHGTTDEQIAQHAGVLGALQDVGFASGFGSADPTLLAASVGSLKQGSFQLGGDGLGARGGHLGRAGTAEGFGDFGESGVAAGVCDADGCGNLGHRGEGSLASVAPSDPILLGALDRSLIDEVIRRNMPSIRYCYQRHLQREPGLEGRVTVKFTIARNGDVSSATVKSSTMGHASLEKCLVGRFQRMSFPPPAGGGVVLVSYPFLFSPG